VTRLLLDTHLVLWWLNDNPRLPATVVERVQAAGAEVFVSQASLWEMAIKVSLGRLRVDLPELESDGEHRDPFEYLFRVRDGSSRTPALLNP
jgi:PIN domain nuclease of toxin-antitoxin system